MDSSNEIFRMVIFQYFMVEDLMKLELSRELQSLINIHDRQLSGHQHARIQHLALRKHLVDDSQNDLFPVLNFDVKLNGGAFYQVENLLK